MSAVPTTTTDEAVAPNQHGLAEHSHGPGTAPVQTRSERFASTDPNEFPAVARPNGSSHPSSGSAR